MSTIFLEDLCVIFIFRVFSQLLIYTNQYSKKLIIKILLNN